MVFGCSCRLERSLDLGISIGCSWLKRELIQSISVQLLLAFGV